MKKLKRIVLASLLLIVLSFLAGCDNTSEVEYTAENNTNIANILFELKETYSLADINRNEITLSGTKTNDESYVDDGAISFILYFASDDWNNGYEAVHYMLKRLSAMCSNNSIPTLTCSVYLNENGYYVKHPISYSYSKDNPENTVLSITEFDSDSLKNSYDAINETYHLEPHNTWEYEGVKYSDADLVLKPGIVGWWNCDANLYFNQDYSDHELIEIGEYAHAFLGSALTIYALENDSIPAHINYDIKVFGNKYYVTGANKDNSETLVWTSDKLK